MPAAMPALNDHITTLTADIATTRQKLTKNAADLVRVEAVGEPARKACQAAQDLRQQRANILSRLIVSGSGKLTSRELDTVEAAIEAARPDEHRAQDLLSAQEGVLATLRQEGADLAQHLAKQTHAVLLAKHEAGRQEIEAEALPAVLVAAEALRVAYGRLAGMRAAHGINAELIQERCGGQKPYSAHKFHPHTFELNCWGVEWPAPHQLGFSAATECRDACADTLRRWGSIGEEVPTIHEARIWPPLR